MNTTMLLAMAGLALLGIPGRPVNENRKAKVPFPFGGSDPNLRFCKPSHLAAASALPVQMVVTVEPIGFAEVPVIGASAEVHFELDSQNATLRRRRYAQPRSLRPCPSSIVESSGVPVRFGDGPASVLRSI